ncbi:hypothetical protein B0T17DRAFT_600718 [Bombardia bombarda]|uniref:Uncharacterized protein n=1 Tax=Bombardia bombarda TaxID=252184 RepID=A0AA39WUS1_9PEZI|nr:hypothetical protein B0T17DRAFT_600718 [Bombardia bombarda]
MSLESHRQNSELFHLSQNRRFDMMASQVHDLGTQVAQNTIDVSNTRMAIDTLSNLVQFEDELGNAQKVLSKLRLDSAPDRSGSISEPYRGTSEWIFESRFSSWLQCRHGIF